MTFLMNSQAQQLDFMNISSVAALYCYVFFQALVGSGG